MIKVECKYCEFMTNKASGICDKCSAHIAKRAHEHRRRRLIRLK